MIVTTKEALNKRWDIFCRVIDNYGDIAVCWRLAKQLVVEHGLQVRLWVDDIAPLAALCPEYSNYEVDVQVWRADFPEVNPADVVIEAFACDLPNSYIAAMQQCPPVWINLEYLSAESWTADFHSKPSALPPLTKHFFFPGFISQTGGLLRERGAFAHPPSLATDTLRISLFGYENNSIEVLLEAWSQSTMPVICMVPHGKLLPQVQAWMGNSTKHGSLTVENLPFMPQDDYDDLLASCDLNFVRGEDSFVRAQLAGKPLVWHIYPQADDAHLPKLQAFLEIYCAGLPAPVARDVKSFHLAWNRGHLDITAWSDFWRHSEILQLHAARWRKQLLAQSDLAGNLVKFCEDVFEKQQNKL
ncbi:MAG TPA: elongation factor P maturation arginine rhamnosyltransferase EarP [Methylophilaceae bacterium]